MALNTTAKPFYERKYCALDIHKIPDLVFKFSDSCHIDLKYVSDATDVIKNAFPALTTRYTLLKRYKDEDLWARSLRGSDIPKDDVFYILFTDYIITVLQSRMPNETACVKDVISYIGNSLVEGKITERSSVPSGFVDFLNSDTTLKVISYYGMSYEVINKTILADIKNWFNTFMSYANSFQIEDMYYTPSTVLLSFLFVFVSDMKQFFNTVVSDANIIVNAEPLKIPETLDESTETKEFIKSVLLNDAVWSVYESMAGMSNISIKDIITGNPLTGFVMNKDFYNKAFDVIVESGATSVLPLIKIQQKFETKWRMLCEFIKDAVFLSMANGTNYMDKVRKLMCLVRFDYVDNRDVDVVEREAKYFYEKIGDSFIPMICEIVDRFYREVTAVGYDKFEVYSRYVGAQPTIQRMESMDWDSDPVMVTRFNASRRKIMDLDFTSQSLTEKKMPMYLYTRRVSDSVFKRPMTTTDVITRKNQQLEPKFLALGDFSEARRRAKRNSTVVVLRYEHEIHTLTVEEQVSCYTIVPAKNGPGVISIGEPKTAGSNDIFTLKQIDPDECSISELVMCFRYGDVINQTNEQLKQLYLKRIEALMNSFDDNLRYKKKYNGVLEVRTTSPVFAYFLSAADDSKIQSMCTDKSYFLLPHGVSKTGLLKQQLPKYVEFDRYQSLSFQGPVRLLNSRMRDVLYREGKYTGPKNVNGLDSYTLTLKKGDPSKAETSECVDTFKLDLVVDMWLAGVYSAGPAKRIESKKAGKMEYKLRAQIRYGTTNFHMDLLNHSLCLINSDGCVNPFRYAYDLSFFDSTKSRYSNAFEALKKQIESYFIVKNGVLNYDHKLDLNELVLQESCTVLYNELMSSWAGDTTLFNFDIPSEATVAEFCEMLKNYEYEQILKCLSHLTVEQLCATEFVPQRLTSFGDFYVVKDILANKVQGFGALEIISGIETHGFEQNFDPLFLDMLPKIVSNVLNYRLCTGMDLGTLIGTDLHEFSDYEDEIIKDIEKSESEKVSEDPGVKFSVKKQSGGKKTYRIIVYTFGDEGRIFKQITVEDKLGFDAWTNSVYSEKFNPADIKDGIELYITHDVFEKL